MNDAGSNFNLFVLFIVEIGITNFCYWRQNSNSNNQILDSYGLVSLFIGLNDAKD